jgi:SpoVK/Ycf46/Vps4 family AAA+-type ATPase
MEEYDGVALLTTNRRRDLDDAFARRLNFAINFPLPDPAQRRRIWDAIWPADVPRAPDLDLEVIASRVELAGGNIRNIALAAAFLAAGDGRRVTIGHLLSAARREYRNLGVLVDDRQFELEG